MSLPRWVVPLLLALLMIDAIIELSLISSMVAWLHSTAGGEFEVIAPEMQDMISFNLHGKPKNLLLNQGHTSNGAAGTAFVLVGLEASWCSLSAISHQRAAKLRDWPP